jgi:transposase
VSLREALPASHLARFVVDLVAQLDPGPICAGDAERGGIAHAPEILLARLFYGYATGVFSARRLEQATYEMLPFRFIAGSPHLDHCPTMPMRESAEVCQSSSPAQTV